MTGVVVDGTLVVDDTQSGHSVVVVSAVVAGVVVVGSVVSGVVVVGAVVTGVVVVSVIENQI